MKTSKLLSVFPLIAHLLEISENIMLGICRPELYTVENNVCECDHLFIVRTDMVEEHYNWRHQTESSLPSAWGEGRHVMKLYHTHLWSYAGIILKSHPYRLRAENHTCLSRHILLAPKFHPAVIFCIAKPLTSREQFVPCFEPVSITHPYLLHPVMVPCALYTRTRAPQMTSSVNRLPAPAISKRC